MSKHVSVDVKLRYNKNRLIFVLLFFFCGNGNDQLTTIQTN